MSAKQKKTVFSRGKLNMHLTVLLLNATYLIPVVLSKEWTL